MDQKGEHSTYRIIGGVSHRLQHPPGDLKKLSQEKLISEIWGLVRIINSGRLHNQKQKKMIDSLEARIRVYQAHKPWSGYFAPEDCSECKIVDGGRTRQLCQGHGAPI